MRRLVVHAAAILAAALALGGCKLAVFDNPVTVSTRSLAVSTAKPLGRVTAERCNYVVLVVPVVRDPKGAYEQLLDLAEERGGNAVMDFQVRDSGLVAVLPFFMRACWEATGVAVRL